MNSVVKKVYKIQQVQPCEVFVGRDAEGEIVSALGRMGYSQIFVLTDKKTKELFGMSIEKRLKKLSVGVSIFAVEGGEKSKSVETLSAVISKMLSLGLDRRSAIVGLGGGVIGDLATAIGGLFMRGIDCVLIPTTFLSQVDSTFGGKGGVNFESYKNVVGVVKQPRFIFVSTKYLDTLGDFQFKVGLAEVIKYGMAMDAGILKVLESRKTIDEKTRKSLILRCSQLKMDAVLKDPGEVGIREHLNFGHTLGHAIELLLGITHGEAISVGMVFALRVSVLKGMLSSESERRLVGLLDKYKLPTSVSGLSAAKILSLMKKDKKSRKGNLRLVLLTDIGKAVGGQVVDEDVVREAMKVVLK